MSLKSISRAGWGAAGEERCAVCGKPLIAFVPACVECGAPQPSATIRQYPAASLAKGTNCTRIAHLSDLHVGERLDWKRSASDVLRFWVRAFADANVDGILISGDLVERATDQSSMEEVKSVLETSGMWWGVVPGNHDVESVPNRIFERVFGRYPQVQRRGQISVLLADSNAGLRMEERGVPERTFGALFCHTEGAIGRAQLSEIERMLAGASGDVRILVMHHHLVHQHAVPVAPYVPVSDQAGGMMRVLRDADLVDDWCAKNCVKLVLHGHQHKYMRFGFRDGGVAVLGGGRSTEAPYRARLLDVGPARNIEVIEVELPV